MIIHHLAVDGVSWRILLEELDHSLTNNMNNVNAAPVAKGSSYRQWYHALQQYGKSAELLSQITYWQQTANSFRPFATDYNYDGNARVKETVSFTVKLDAHHTLNLVKEVPRVYHTEINDILLCALAKTLCTWSGRDRLVIGLEGHGRESVDDTTDVSRTVGWFTSLYPLLLTVAETTGTSELIKSVKEQLRQVPGKGLGFGVLKYINKEEAVKGRNPWYIQFNYLGQLDNVIKESKWLAVAPEATGAGRNEEQEVVEKLSFNSHIRLGQLVISWQYSPKHYSPETVKGLAAHYLSTLEMLIAHCLEQVKSGTVFTPSDYGLGSSVSFRELDAFLEEDTNDSIMSF
jgi:non-ribosomal peptide synthase protein (TIGR01720 family)